MTENRKSIIKTEIFFLNKWNPKFQYEGECLITAESPKAYLVRMATIPGEFSLSSFWIPKSKIINIKFYNKFPSELKHDYKIYEKTMIELKRVNGNRGIEVPILSFEEYCSRFLNC